MWPLLRLLPISLLLVGFRPPSRNTQGFVSPANGEYSLPALELLSCIKGATFDALPSDTLPQLVPFRASKHLWELQGVRRSDAVVAVRRAVLCHSLFEALGEGGASVEAAALSAANHAAITPGALEGDAAFAAAGVMVAWFGSTAFEDPHLDMPTLHPGKEELRRRTAVWRHATTGGAAGMSLPCSLEVFCRNTSQTAASDSQVVAAWHLFAQRLAFGPAVDAATGSVASSLSLRRPRAGILRTLARHGRRGLVKTSLEPELALTMANLAAIGNHGPRQRVLDPFTGSASILMAAAFLGNGAGRMVGVDAAAFRDQPSLAADVVADWRRLGIHPLPRLATGNILEWDVPGSTFVEAAGEALFDAIITDPPYGIGATPFVQPVGGTEAGEEPRSPEKKSLRELYRHDDVRRLFAALLLLAAQKLRSGGRLVFFCPEPFLSEFDGEGGASDHRGGLFLGLPLPEPLVLLHAQRQIFRGGTFSRLLVVVEKA